MLQKSDLFKMLNYILVKFWGPLALNWNDVLGGGLDKALQITGDIFSRRNWPKKEGEAGELSSLAIFFKENYKGWYEK